MRVWMLGVIALAALGLSVPAGAQTPSKCLSSQIKAAAAHASAKAKCESKAAAKGEAVDPACLAKAELKALQALGKAENKDDCVVTGVDAPLDGAVEDFVAEVLDILNPPPLICCFGGSVCLYTTDAAACAAPPNFGTPGAEGSVCTGSGTCAPPPAAAGNCCEDLTISGTPFDCVNGDFDAPECASAGGTFSTGICTPSGFCQ